MGNKKLLTGNDAVALAVKQCMNVPNTKGIIAVFPITPQTNIAKFLVLFKDKGLFNNVEIVDVDGEYSAAAVCYGGSLKGARVFTATSSHGLFYMYEMLYWLAAHRIPLVLVNVTRGVGSPWVLWSDHNDAMSLRDFPAIQFFAASCQEAYDMVPIAYRLAEQEKLIVIINMEGFILSHSDEPVEILEQEEIDRFLPPLKPDFDLISARASAGASSDIPDFFYELRRLGYGDLKKSASAFYEISDRFHAMCGRRYLPLETHEVEDAEIVLVCVGTVFETAQIAIKNLGTRRKKIGTVRLALLRPFPGEELLAALNKPKKIVVLDQNNAGVMFHELRSLFYGRKKMADISGVILGIGGKEIAPETIENIVSKVENREIKNEILWWDYGTGAESREEKKSPVAAGTINVNDNQVISPGHRACSGCGSILGLKMILEEFTKLGQEITLVIPAGCASIYSGLFPFSALNVRVVHAPFAASAPVASGASRGVKLLGGKEIIVCWAGDGATFDIGFGPLSGACERGENIIYICNDNEACMNTGNQKSGATPWLATTETSLHKQEKKKDIDAMIAAHGVAYLATMSLAFPDDLSKKTKKAIEINGTRFMHLFSPCPAGWKYSQKNTVALARMAVMSCVFPLFEVESGRWTVNFYPGDKKISVAEYLRPDDKSLRQERFKDISDEEIRQIQREIDANWEKLLKKADSGWIEIRRRDENN